MVKPEELEALLVVARKHNVKRLCVTQGGVEVELEPLLVPVTLLPAAQSAPAAPAEDEKDPLFDAVE